MNREQLLQVKEEIMSKSTNEAYARSNRKINILTELAILYSNYNLNESLMNIKKCNSNFNELSFEEEMNMTEAEYMNLDKQKQLLYIVNYVSQLNFRNNNHDNLLENLKTTIYNGLIYIELLNIDYQSKPTEAVFLLSMYIQMELK